jgi:hypothetical protein
MQNGHSRTPGDFADEATFRKLLATANKTRNEKNVNSVVLGGGHNENVISPPNIHYIECAAGFSNDLQLSASKNTQSARRCLRFPCLQNVRKRTISYPISDIQRIEI